MADKYYYHQMEFVEGTKKGDTPTILPRQSGSKTQESISNTPIVAQNGENANTSSSFARNTSTNPNFSDQTRRALKNNPVSYNPVTNEERLARANEILGTKSTDEVDTYLRDNFFNVNSSKKLK